MLIEFRGIVKRVEVKEKKTRIYVESDYGRSLIISYAKSGRLPLDGNMISITTNFPTNTLMEYLSIEVNIKANLINAKDFNYLSLKEISSLE